VSSARRTRTVPPRSRGASRSRGNACSASATPIAVRAADLRSA
jgi:hypothetical protein